MLLVDVRRLEHDKALSAGWVQQHAGGHSCKVHPPMQEKKNTPKQTKKQTKKNDEETLSNTSHFSITHTFVLTTREIAKH